MLATHIYILHIYLEFLSLMSNSTKNTTNIMNNFINERKFVIIDTNTLKVYSPM